MPYRDASPLHSASWELGFGVLREPGNQRRRELTLSSCNRFILQG